MTGGARKAGGSGGPQAAEDAGLQAPHPHDVAIVWFLPAGVGTLGLIAAGAPLAAVSGGGLLFAAACALAWRLLASRPSDFETIVAVARGHRLTALRARRIWAPLNGQWRRPRQYGVVVRDRRRQLRSLQVAFPVLGRGPVWVRLSLDGAPEGRS